jgi:hypothetical protein
MEGRDAGTIIAIYNERWLGETIGVPSTGKITGINLVDGDDVQPGYVLK